MYLIFEKDETIKVIQGYLGIVESGNYDSNTKNAVIDFQKKNGLNQSGRVDKETFELLRQSYYRRLASDSDANADALHSFPYKKNDFGNDISVINSHISTALENYTYYERLPKGAYFDIYTERAIERLRDIFSLEGDYMLDKTLYARIKRDIFTKYS